MFSTITGGFSFINDTLLTYNGDLNGIVISHDVNGGCVKKIGAGAFYNQKTLSEIIIEEGIEQINEAAFARALSLKYVYIPESVTFCHPEAFMACNALSRVVADRRLSRNTYENLKSSCISPDGTNYILTAPHEEIESLSQIYTGLSSLVKPACKVSVDMRRLFLKKIAAGGRESIKKTNIPQNERDAFAKKVSFFEQKKSIRLDKSATEEIESRALKEKLKLNGFEPYSEAADIKNDSAVKRRKDPFINEVIVVSFSDKNCVITENGVVVRFVFDIGQYFWQSTRKIVIDKKNYYVYRREFLTSEADYPYIRRDISVLDEKYAELEPDEAKQVYAKYLLASLL